MNRTPMVRALLVAFLFLAAALPSMANEGPRTLKAVLLDFKGKTVTVTDSDDDPNDRRMNVTAAQLVEVGDDYVLLRFAAGKEGILRYIPLQRIRSITRRDDSARFELD